MTVRFTSLDGDTIEGLASWVSENSEQFVRALLDGSLTSVLNQATAETAAASAAPKQAEPQVHSVVSFTNRSPSDGIRRSYSAYRTNRGWATSSGTNRLPKDATWAQIVDFADGNVEVLRDGPAA
jgi:hypothetical protein